MYQPSRLRRVLAAVCLVACVVAPPPAPAAPQRLPAGSEKGTFCFVCEGSVYFTGSPMYPVSIAVTRPDTMPVELPGVTDDHNAAPARPGLAARGADVAKTMIVKPKPFRLEADLRPGLYVIRSRMTTDKGRRAYGDADGPTLYISPSGVATLSDDSMVPRVSMTHVQRIIPGAPKTFQSLPDKRPTLKWDPVPRAASYTIRWLVLSPADRTVLKTGKPVKTTTPQYTFVSDVAAGALYEWSVSADNADGDELARLPAAFFVTAPTTTKDVRGAGPGSGWLGAGVRPATPDDERANPDAEAGSGLIVGDVLPGSPAAAAGLKKDDVILSIDGVSADNIAAFLGCLISYRPGQRATLTVRRDGEDVKLPVTIQSALRSTPDAEPAPESAPDPAPDGTRAGAR